MFQISGATSLKGYLLRWYVGILRSAMTSHHWNDKSTVTELKNMTVKSLWENANDATE